MTSRSTTAGQATESLRPLLEPDDRLEDGPLVGNDPFLTFPGARPEQRCVLEPNINLGRFVVQRHLGSGGWADVYKARDSLRGVDVAIKVARLAPGDSVAAEHLHHELRASEAITDHCHVIKHFDLHDIAWGGSRLAVLSMEYADGGDLGNWLETNRNAVARRRQHAGQIIRQIGLGVAALHQVGHLHLDIKPSNVLFVNGSLKVSDFGVPSPARRLQARQSKTSPPAGTPAFMSSQRRAGQLVAHGETEDIFSLGVMYYVMCSSSASPPAAADMSLLENGRAAARIVDLQGLDIEELNIIRRCLAADPSRRYQSVGKLLADVEGFLHRDREAEVRQIEIEAVWQEACRFFQQSRFKQAGEACQRILASQPDHTGAAAMRAALLDRHSRAAGTYAALDRGIDTWDLDTLVSLLQEAAGIYPEHPSGRTVHARVSAKAKQYRQAMEEGRSAVRNSEWEAAGYWFALARRQNPGAKVVEDANCLTSQVLGRLQYYRSLISQAIAAGDDQKAMQLARNADGYQQQMSRRFLSQGERQL